VDDLLIVIGGVAIFGAWSAFGAFLLLFHVLADWQSSPMGRHMMVFMGVIAAILSYALAVYLIADDHAGGIRAWLRIIMYGSLATVGWWRVAILVRLQRETRQSVSDTLGGSTHVPR
jgi:hypothetical protein